jgi:excisionase family DNA binding protein
VSPPSLPDVIRMLADVIEREQAKRTAAPVSAEAPPLAWVPLMQSGLPEKTARRAVRDGEIAASRVGRDVYVLRADVERFIAARQIVQRDTKPENDQGSVVDQAIARRRLRLAGGRR